MALVVVKRTKSTRRERRQQVQEAARRIIANQGMEKLTMESLAGEIGISVAAIYRHVEDKHEILLLVLDDIERTLMEGVAEGQKQGDSALERLQGILKTRLSYAERRRGVTFLVVNEAVRLDDARLRRRASDVVERYLDAVAEVLRQGQQEGTVRQDLDVDTAASLFFGMVQSKVTLWALRSRSFSLSDGWEGLWDLYCAAIRKPR